MSDFDNAKEKLDKALADLKESGPDFFEAGKQKAARDRKVRHAELLEQLDQSSTPAIIFMALFLAAGLVAYIFWIISISWSWIIKGSLLLVGGYFIIIYIGWMLQVLVNRYKKKGGDSKKSGNGT